MVSTMQEPRSPVTPDYHLWSCYDQYASENEVIELLGALVRAEKPKLAVEVGTHRGLAAEAIGAALERNGRGHLHTFEVDTELADEARERVSHLPVSVHTMSDTEMGPDFAGEIDFLFVDGFFQTREQSLNHWLPALRENALIAIHDTLKFVEPHEAAMSFDAAERVHIITPRGLTLMRRGVTPPPPPT
jgi:predicted O-methyltransferase YrrM